MDNTKIIAQKLLEINAIKLKPSNPFTWASGMRSPIYCDNRITLSYPHIRTMIKDSLAELSKSYDFDMIAGVATAGIPHGALLADLLGVPFAYIRSKPKAHGRQNQVEGKIDKDSKVLLVEDLISTGKSSLEAVNVVRNIGADCVGVIAIFSYDFDIAKDNFKKENCKYSVISDYPTLIEQALNIEYINAQEAKTLAQWSANPKDWYANNN